MKKKVLCFMSALLMVFGALSTLVWAEVSETRDLSGIVTWEDEDSKDRPEKVTVYIMEEDKIIAEAKASAENDWVWTVKDLPVFSENGEEIVYSVRCEGIDHYMTKIIAPEAPFVAVDELQKVPNCNFTSFSLNGADLVIAKLTKAKGYLVWTKDNLSKTEKEELLTYVADFLHLKEKKDILFLSQIDAVYTDGNRTATFGEDEITFSKENVWSMFWYGDVSVKGYVIKNTLNTEEETEPPEETEPSEDPKEEIPKDPDEDKPSEEQKPHHKPNTDKNPIILNGKTEKEKNPSTGAPVLNVSTVLLLTGAAIVLAYKMRK